MKCDFAHHIDNPTPVAKVATALYLCGQCLEALRAHLLIEGTNPRNDYQPGNPNVQRGRAEFAALSARDKGLIDDYVKIYVILEKNEFWVTFQMLSESITREPAKKLTHHLRKFETLCWFPAVDIIPTGVLSSEQFYDMVKQGVIWKDVGATPNHGLYTHRLQWHGILFVVTDGFTRARGEGWNNGGYKLFVQMGKNPLCRQKNLWGKILDASGGSQYYRAPEKVEKEVGQHWPNIKLLIDNKYQLYMTTFKRIFDTALEKGTEAKKDLEAKRKYEKGTPKGVEESKAILKEANRLTNNWLEQLWGAYYFGVRGIEGVDTDRKLAEKKLGIKIGKDDKLASKKWGPGRVAYTNSNHNIIKLVDQKTPSALEVQYREEMSDERLNDNPATSRLDRFG